ncbi:hypothetical protein [Roseisolibacter sp. H3M3-2]|uniref:hypothetical protein n=1 Tax=Roseisolibacter sp. H3M3-2 TaxID=3031323 RepID=UPI0023DBA14C|nr:hypothetical protein [Roseisolibacter sp. H3M3-2]MDF1503863.1 hypothetical protein [Roseisolibacter sp. H3M3-2]
MTSARIRPLILAAAGAALLSTMVACAESPLAPVAPEAPAPAAAPQRGLVSGTVQTLTNVAGLRWTAPATRASATKVIGAGGGTLTVGGLTMIVPRGAVAGSTTFTVTRLPGSVVAYDFQPHGIRFAQPVTLRVATLGTGIGLLPTLTGVQGAHFVDEASLNQAAGRAAVTELRPARVDLLGVTFDVTHFSGWMVSTGRSGGDDNGFE